MAALLGPSEHAVEQSRAHWRQDRFGVELEPDLSLVAIADRHRHSVEDCVDAKSFRYVVQRRA